MLADKILITVSHGHIHMYNALSMALYMCIYTCIKTNTNTNTIVLLLYAHVLYTRFVKNTSIPEKKKNKKQKKQTKNEQKTQSYSTCTCTRVLGRNHIASTIHCTCSSLTTTMLCLLINVHIQVQEHLNTVELLIWLQ